MKHKIIITVASQTTAAYEKGDFLVTLERFEPIKDSFRMAVDSFVVKAFLNRDNAMNFANKMGLLFDCRVSDETL